MLGGSALYEGLGVAAAAVIPVSLRSATVAVANLRTAVVALGLVFGGVGGAAQQTDPSLRTVPQGENGSTPSVDNAPPTLPSDSGLGSSLGRGADSQSPELDVALDRHFNEVKRELLDQRGKSIDHWLTVISLVLTFFAIVIAIAGLWAYRSFQSMEAEAKRSAAAARVHEEKARKVLREITGHREESERHLGLIRGVTSEIAEEKPAEATKAAEAVWEDPDASAIDKAIGRAVSLQGDGEIDEAISLWRSIWSISEAVQDTVLTLRACFSIGFLLLKRRPEEAITHFSKVIELDPANAKAFVNRGVAKGTLGRHLEALADFDKAIELDPANAKAYFNRGVAGTKMGDYADAVADLGKAIELDPTNANAFLKRGAAKAELGLEEDARDDYEAAQRLLD